MTIHKTVVGLMLALSMILAACGGDDDDGGGGSDVDISGLVDGLAETLDISQSDATCVAESLVDSLGEDKLLDFRDADREPTDEETDAILTAVIDCDVPVG